MDRGEGYAAEVLGWIVWPHVEEVSEERNGGPHAHECLTIKGKYGLEENGVRVKMQGLNLVVVEDIGEEPGERWDEPREDVV